MAIAEQFCFSHSSKQSKTKEDRRNIQKLLNEMLWNVLYSGLSFLSASGKNTVKQSIPRWWGLWCHLHHAHCKPYGNPKQDPQILWLDDCPKVIITCFRMINIQQTVNLEEPLHPAMRSPAQVTGTNARCGGPQDSTRWIQKRESSASTTWRT